MKRPVRPTEVELKLLRILWDLGPSTVKQVHVHLNRTEDYAYTGVLLICLGLLLALPLPMTNFVFAGTLLLFALALMERDGALMLVLWTLSTAGLVATGLLSEELARLVHGWLA